MRRALAIAALALVAREARAEYYPPPTAYVAVDDLPSDLVQTTGSSASIAKRIRVKDFLYTETKSETDPEKDIGATMDLQVVVTQGFDLTVPGLEDVFALSFGAADYRALVALREEESSDPAKNYPFLGTFSATPFPIELKLKGDFFVPMKKSGTAPNFVYEKYAASDPAPVPGIRPKTGVTVIVKYTWDGELDVEFDAGGGAVEFELTTPIMLADSGVVIDAESITVDLSESGPSTDADPSWKGVRLGSFRVAFTNGIDLPDAEVAGGSPTTAKWTGVSFTNFEIGTGGFSGRMCGNGIGAAMGSIDLFSMEFEPTDLCVELKRNSLVGSEIKGTLKNFPFFEEDIAVTLAFDLEGNFTVGIADPDPTDADDFIKWTIPNVLDFYVGSIAFEHREGIFLVRLNGEIEPLFFDSDVQSDGPTRIAVNGLTITSEGDVSLEGGWVTLPQKRYIDFHAFQIGLAQIGFGKNKDTDGKSWVGFTGGIKLVDGLDAEAEVKKLQFLWDSSFDVSVKLEGIKVAFHEEGVIDFEGAVDWFETTASPDIPGAKGFAGKLDIGLPAINLTVGGRIVIGKAANPSGGDFAFFYLDLETQFPAGIPIFSGVSLYGLSGLFALNMSPNLRAFTTPVQWFNAYRTATNIVVGSPPTWRIDEGALAFGAGVILGTTDNGYTVNGKLALTIALPGPIVMIQGQANVLKERTSLSNPAETPLFVALAIYDGSARTFIINIGVFYELASVVKVSGEAEAFFDLADPGNWHLWLGKKDPESARITATALGFLTANTYYMIDPDGLAFGAKASFGKSWKFGPLKVALEAWFGWDAAMSWRPIHVWGQVDVGGRAELKAFGIGVGVHVHATLELETPKPYRIEGDFKVKLSLPWPLPDPKATIHLKWEKPGTKAPLTEAVAGMTIHSRKDGLVLKPAREDDSHATTRGAVSSSIALASLCTPGASLPAVGALELDVSSSCGMPMVALDSFASMKFERRMNDKGNVGRDAGYSLDPDFRFVDQLDDVKYEYQANALELIYGVKTGTWPVPLTIVPPDVHGSWTSIPASESESTNDNLDVLSKNPFRNYENATTLGYTGEEWTDWAAEHMGDGYCFDGREGIRTGHDQMPGHSSTHGHYQSCSGLEWVEDEDFVLPPYAVFRLTIDGSVLEPAGTPSYRVYRNSVYFHTEGPPLDLMPYVARTVPELPWKPHYRSYDVTVRFDESYMNKLYRTAADQFLQVQLLDESENPVPGTVTTAWGEAQDATVTAAEQAWYDVLIAHGAISSIPKDDLLAARASETDALRPGVKHRARLVLEDPRLAADTRLLDATWMQRNAPRFVSADRKRVVVGEVDFLASRYDSLHALTAAWRGRWYRLTSTETPALVQIRSAAAPAFGAFLDGSAAVPPHDSGAIGRWLRDLLSPRAPEEIPPDEQRAWALRTPGLSSATIGDAQLAAAVTAWSAAGEAFESIDDLLELELAREPLPHEPELLVVTLGSGERAGFLLELPEALDLSRVEIEITPPSGTAYRPIVVPNADTTRLFLFQPSGTTLAPIADGTHAIRLELHRDLGAKNPVFTHRDAAVDEGTLSVEVPGGEFIP